MRHILLVCLVACGPTISTVKTNPSPRPLRARPTEAVEIYTTARPVRPYVEVAVFTAAKGKAEEHIDALRSRAAEYGCDALVFTVMPSQQDVALSSSSSKPGTPSSSSSGTAVGSSSATCVVF